MRQANTKTAVLLMSLVATICTGLPSFAEPVAQESTGVPAGASVRVADGAAGKDEKMRAAIDAVQERLQATFRSMRPEFIGPGPIEGLYELIVGGRLIYYAPEKNWLLFGEFFSPEGVSETQKRLSELQARKIDQLPLDQAITVGSGPIEVIEFVDPDCPYCKRWSEFASKRSDLTRHVFLVPLDQLHPTARGKAEHILCAQDPAQTMEDFYAGRIGTDKLVGCEEGKKRLAVHEGAARLLGVSGTPTLVIAGQVITGFNPARIQSLLKKAKEE